MYFQLGLAEPDVIALFYYPDSFFLNQTCNMYLTLRTLYFSVCMKAKLYGTFVCDILRSHIHLLLYNY